MSGKFWHFSSKKSGKKWFLRQKVWNFQFGKSVATLQWLQTLLLFWTSSCGLKFKLTFLFISLVFNIVSDDDESKVDYEQSTVRHFWKFLYFRLHNFNGKIKTTKEVLETNSRRQINTNKRFMNSVFEKRTD